MEGFTNFLINAYSTKNYIKVSDKREYEANFFYMTFFFGYLIVEILVIL